MDDQLLTPREVAAVLRLSVSQVRRLLGSGALPGFKLPGLDGRPSRNWLTSAAALRAYVDRQIAAREETAHAAK